MFKVIGVIVLVAVQFGSFCEVAADPDPVASGRLERRDSVNAFFASQITLQNAANVFAADRYSGAFPANVTELEGIAAHIKSCRDATDAAIVQLAELLPTFAEEVLTIPEAVLLNTTYLPSTQQAILHNLDELQSFKPFFESVNNSPLLSTLFCHWVGDLARENDAFFNLLRRAAPFPVYSSYWGQLQSDADLQYQLWLTEDGFNCNGLY
ncbi:hypothetical protein DFH09DRAFT_1283797 [Mycena vulgaris]|nr:hypothetical protein DFH09DRAFT_1208858 [Mycena vulgaris]KAJ6536603.1 hypothetical protein DFH09DRAFT_1283797 [Mycena vulgaris]